MLTRAAIMRTVRGKPQSLLQGVQGRTAFQAISPGAALFLEARFRHPHGRRTVLDPFQADPKHTGFFQNISGNDASPAFAVAERALANPEQAGRFKLRACGESHEQAVEFGRWCIFRCEHSVPPLSP